MKAPEEDGGWNRPQVGRLERSRENSAVQQFVTFSLADESIHQEAMGA